MRGESLRGDADEACADGVWPRAPDDPSMRLRRSARAFRTSIDH